MQSWPDPSGEGWPQMDPTTSGSRQSQPRCQAVASRWGSPGETPFGDEGKESSEIWLRGQSTSASSSPSAGQDTYLLPGAGSRAAQPLAQLLAQAYGPGLILHGLQRRSQKLV